MRLYFAYYIMLIKQIDQLQEKQTIAFLKKNLIDITKMVDQSGNTLAHLAIITPRLQKLQIYIEYVQKNFNSKASDFFLSKNKKEMSIAHLACSQQDIKFVKFLMQKNISFRQSGANGLTVTHLAAKYNLVKILQYLRGKGFSLQQQDNAKAKPLHWAAFSGAVESVQYLIGCKVSLNQLDKDGNNCLHLACAKGHSDIIKILLIHGCKQTENNLKKLPEQLCRQSQRHIFKRPSILEQLVFYFNYKFPMKKVDRSHRIVFLFFLIFVFLFLVTYLLGIYKLKQFNTKIYVEWSYIIFNFINFLLHLSLSFIVKLDKVPPLIETQFLKLIENNDTDVCYFCRNVRPNRAKHCEICNKCVRIYDHHCPWINNCVGRGNLRIFLLFLIFSFVNICVSTSILIISLVQNILLDWQKIVICVSLLPCLLSFIFLGGLLYVQLNNFLFNLTTYQRFSNRARAKRQSLLDSDQPKEDRRSIGNCIAMCCYKEEEDE